ncbi:hypothetical protein CEXT_205751 [Caerostris extrusa]|uniref:Uncharacterized protein n=1 Tax=Caerostris extrusa TaxID=172846 RepID=A0AAV4P489_CAEEX|nr:hypothetical protein CEXT_205751 [Caerostris extrusa]
MNENFFNPSTPFHANTEIYSMCGGVHPLDPIPHHSSISENIKGVPLTLCHPFSDTVGFEAFSHRGHPLPRVSFKIFFLSTPPTLELKT